MFVASVAFKTLEANVLPQKDFPISFRIKIEFRMIIHYNEIDNNMKIQSKLSIRI